MPLTMYKRRRRILPYTPNADPQRRLKQMGTLATALTALNMEFSNDLTYMPGMAPKSANQAKLEKGGMQVKILAEFYVLPLFPHMPCNLILYLLSFRSLPEKIKKH